MSAVTAIYKAPVVGKAVLPDAGEVSIIIQYQGRIYQGVALLHPEDKDFFSEKVGCNIALSRARIEALADVLYETRQEARYKEQMLYEVTRFGEFNGKNDMYDPTQMFRQNVCKAIMRVENLEAALQKEREMLDNYLKGHGKAIESIKRQRSASPWEVEEGENK